MTPCGLCRPASAASLVQDLTAQRTAAISAILANNPHVALAAIVHALAGKVFYGRHGTTCLGIPRDRRNCPSQ